MKDFRSEGGIVKTEEEKQQMAEKHRFKKNREFKKRLDEDEENEAADIRSFKFYSMERKRDDRGWKPGAGNRDGEREFKRDGNRKFERRDRKPFDREARKPFGRDARNTDRGGKHFGRGGKREDRAGARNFNSRRYENED